MTNYISGATPTADTNVTMTMTYDSDGELLTMTDPKGTITQMSYDGYGNVAQSIANYQSGVTATAAVNVATSSTYDIMGRTLTSTNALGIVTQYTYDNLGERTQTIANYQSGVTPSATINVTSSQIYDVLGRPTTTTNPRGIANKTIYNADGRVIRVTLNFISGGAQNSITNVRSQLNTYDAAGNVLTSTDANAMSLRPCMTWTKRALQTTRKDSAGKILQTAKLPMTMRDWTLTRSTLDASGNTLLTLTYG